MYGDRGCVIPTRMIFVVWWLSIAPRGDPEEGYLTQSRCGGAFKETVVRDLGTWERGEQAEKERTKPLKVTIKGPKAGTSSLHFNMNY